MTGDFSELTKKEDEIFHQYIKMLQDWRDMLWQSSILGTSAFLATTIKDMFSLKDELVIYDFVSAEVAAEFDKEFYMTMYLFEKCLTKSENKNMTPSSDEYKTAVEEIRDKLEEYSDSIHDEGIVTALKEEDPTARKALEQLGFESDRIDEILAKGYNPESVLDEVSVTDLKK